MTEKFKLSNKRLDVELFTPSGFNPTLKAVYNEKDVKEFIKRLKEEISHNVENTSLRVYQKYSKHREVTDFILELKRELHKDNFMDIDKLAGSQLTK